MSFRASLEEVVKSVSGSVACSVMGFDGIAVETVQPDAQSAADLDVGTALIEYGNLLSQLKQAAEGLKTGQVTEISVNTDKLLTIMRMVNNDYYVVLALLPDGNYGKGRYALRLAAPKLAREL